MASASTALQHKHAVIFGAGGDVGSVVARAFAAQGVTLFLSGRQRGLGHMKGVPGGKKYHPIDTR